MPGGQWPAKLTNSSGRGHYTPTPYQKVAQNVSLKCWRDECGRKK